MKSVFEIRKSKNRQYRACKDCQNHKDMNMKKPVLCCFDPLQSYTDGAVNPDRKTETDNSIF